MPPERNKPLLLCRPERNATLRQRPEDFEVEEVPAYLPSGEGEHLFVLFEKTNLTTAQAVSLLSRALGVNERETGIAGQKDKVAVTRQWASFPRVTVEQLKEAEEAHAESLKQVRVLDAAAHPHKLKTGHLKANRFRLILRDTQLSDDELFAFIEQVKQTGFANYFGVQRFRDAQLVEQAVAWLRGEIRPPRSRTKLKWWMSTVQSALFNEWLAARISDGKIHTAIEGDVLKKEETGGLFVCTEPEVDAARVRAWEVSPTGPIWGAKMRTSEGEAGAREHSILTSFGLEQEDFRKKKRAGAGTRRVARVRPEELCFERLDPASIRLQFSLPKGSYATELLRELLGKDPDFA